MKKEIITLGSLTRPEMLILDDNKKALIHPYNEWIFAFACELIEHYSDIPKMSNKLLFYLIKSKLTMIRHIYPDITDEEFEVVKSVVINISIIIKDNWKKKQPGPWEFNTKGKLVIIS